MSRISYMRLRKLAEKIWRYLNGRYEDYDKEVNKIAEMIEKTLYQTLLQVKYLIN